MKQNNEKFYITTPIYYPSDNFHIGHCYTTVIADALARYHRLKGEDVFFLTGSDEHGQKIEERAKSAGKAPQEFVDVIVDNAKDLWKHLDITYDKFIRTTDAYHIETVQKIFKKLYEQGDIYKGEYEGWYCRPCESFWTETQLADGNCPDCARAVQKTKEEAYFLRLSKYQKQLETYLANNPSLMQPETRYKEMVNNFLKPGLKDVAVSRTSFTWGVPVCFDANHVVYVWVDALSNYISALGYLSDDDALFQKYWPADLHLVGKEIFRFHTLIWPIMCMALDIALPKKVYGHGWLVIDGSKISKSLGNYKDPREYIKNYGVDAIRYYLLSEVPFGHDGGFSEKLLVERSNSDLANVLGNLVNRSVSMANKYFDGVVENRDTHKTMDEELITMINQLADKVDTSMLDLHVDEAIRHIMDVLKRTNKFVDESEPWKLGKEDSERDRLHTVLYTLLESVRICAIILEAFIPTVSKRVLQQLQATKTDFDCLMYGGEISYHVVKKPTILFTRIDEKALAAKWAQEEAQAAGAEVVLKETITFDDFMKNDLRVGKVISCKKHNKADKLLVSQVDLGFETRQIVSGIAQSYAPEDLIGRKVVVVANLKSATIRGEVSQGMILASERSEDMQVIFVDDLDVGASVR
ncbi:MAG: methionine--tRNA ligase [Breznakia sp.]